MPRIISLLRLGQLLQVKYLAKITFCSYIDNRGGIWRFVVDGGAPVDISVWNSTIGTVDKVVATGIDAFTEHTVVATFMGDDSARVPSGGAGRAEVGCQVRQLRPMVQTGYCKALF
jgi:hypothetical protein